MRRNATWRRLVGLLLLVCLVLSSVEVVWADDPMAPSPSSQIEGSAESPVLEGDEGADPDDETDCACLCACACVNAEQVTGAAAPLQSPPDRTHPLREPSQPQNPPRSAPPEPHVRPPIA